MGLLGPVGEGCQNLTVAVTGGEYTDVDAKAALALAPGGIGGAVVGTNHADDRSRVLGWPLSDCTAHSLNRAEIFNAYCTHAAIGEASPLGPGME
ncbi:hypothetical protein [Streptomyces sp. NPDC046182]|uniref:hypothetical protein n=1 Tax=Streptomyces sp. NPDC046182 TaxID=3154601 RepID=UPI0033FC4C70